MSGIDVAALLALVADADLVAECQRRGLTIEQETGGVLVTRERVRLPGLDVVGYPRASIVWRGMRWPVRGTTARVVRALALAEIHARRAHPEGLPGPVRVSVEALLRVVWGGAAEPWCVIQAVSQARREVPGLVQAMRVQHRAHYWLALPAAECEEDAA